MLDSSLRMPLTSKLLSNARKGISKPPLIVSSSFCKKSEREKKCEAISEAGGNVLFVDDPGASSHSVHSPATHGFACCAGPGIDLRRLVHNLDATPSLGRSIMVEGGASVISSFLSTPGLVDLVIVTVAPVLVGDDGVSAAKEGVSGFLAAAGCPELIRIAPQVELPRFEHLRTQVFGKDAVFVCKPVYP